MNSLVRFIILSVVIVTSVQAQSWERISGPPGGQASDFAKQGTTIFANTYGGAYKNSGSQWELIGLEGYEGLAIVANETQLYALSTTDVHRSLDGGLSWTKITPTDSSSNVSICLTGQAVLVGTS